METFKDMCDEPWETFDTTFDVIEEVEDANASNLQSQVEDLTKKLEFSREQFARAQEENGELWARIYSEREKMDSERLDWEMGKEKLMAVIRMMEQKQLSGGGDS